MYNDGSNSATTERHSSFSDMLDELKQRGCSVLVSGLVPNESIDQLSIHLLGNSTTQRDRVRLFGLIGRNIESVYDRLALINTEEEPTSVINASNTARSAGTVAYPDDTIRLNQTVVSNAIADFSMTLYQTIAEIERNNGRLEPAELRVCIDSLSALLSENETEQVELFLDDINQIAIGTNSLIHAILPSKYDRPVVRRLKPYFDIVINLRMANGEAVQQWELPLSGHQTEWFPIEDSRLCGR